MPSATRKLEDRLEHEIDPAVQEELLKHPGKWAAITRSAVIAIEDNPDAALSRAHELGFDAPILYWIPDTSTSFFF